MLESSGGVRLQKEHPNIPGEVSRMSIFRGFPMLFVLMLCVALTTAQTDRITTVDRITIYVSGPIRDGFVDTTKDIQDSIKDISNILKKMKEFQLVDSREEADINLTVVTRGVGSEAFGERLRYTEHYDQTKDYNPDRVYIPDGGYNPDRDYKRTILVESVPIITTTRWVASVLEVGQYRKEFLGSVTQKEDYYNWTPWGDCAGEIAGDVKAWVVTNREQLMQRRKISQP